MRALSWIVGIFALGAGLVLAARYNTGYVLIVASPYRVELSLNLLILLIIVGYLLAYTLTRMLVTAAQLPARVRAYRVERRRARQHAALIDALREWLAGHYAEAEQAADSIVLPEYVGVAAILAAKAAHELRAYERRDAHLEKARSAAPSEETIRVMTEAQFLLEAQQPREAMDVLRALPQKDTAALRLELRLQQALRNWDQVLPLIDQLEKRNVLDTVQAGHLRRRAHVENLKRKGMDAMALGDAWKKVTAPLRADPQVAAAAAQAYLRLGDGLSAQRIIEAGLEESWNPVLITLYGECAGDTVRQIERAEAWLKYQPRDAALLLALARLCARQELWGKAQNYVEAGISVEPTYEAHLEAARLQERLGRNDAARRHYHDSLELALARLRELQESRGVRDEASATVFSGSAGGPYSTTTMSRLSAAAQREAPPA
jgi:HemY protein